jgi:hypothetical protein
MEDDLKRNSERSYRLVVHSSCNPSINATFLSRGLKLASHKLREIKELVEKTRRRIGIQLHPPPLGDAGDDPHSPVPASLKPRPSRNSGAVALPEPEENTFSDLPPSARIINRT